jgi:hypothetical protein
MNQVESMPFLGRGQTRTDSNYTSSPTHPGKPNRRIGDASAGKGFDQIARKARILPDGPYKFLGRLRDLSYRTGYVELGNEDLAELADKSRSTIAGYLSVLTTMTVPDYGHSFVFSVQIRGKRRLYPVDRDGNPTVPPEIASRARPKNRARSAGKLSAPATPPLIESLAPVVVVRPGDENEPPNPLERKRLGDCVTESTLAIEAIGGLPEVVTEQVRIPEQLLAEASAAIPAPAPPPVVAQAVEIVETPRVASWADLTDSKPEVKKTREQRVLDVLTPEERQLFNALPLARQGKLAREFDYAPDARGVRYLKKELEPRPNNGPVVTAATPTADLIKQLPSYRDPFAPDEASRRVNNEFKDPGFVRGREMIMKAVWLGTLKAEDVAFAYEQATARMPCGPRRGKYFWRALMKRAGITGDDLAPLARGEHRDVRR